MYVPMERVSCASAVSRRFTSPAPTACSTCSRARASPARASATSMNVPRSKSAAPSTVATMLGMSWFLAVSCTPMSDRRCSTRSSSSWMRL
jgi:hypothetical protein